MSSYDAVVLDIDGVLVTSWAAIDGAADAVRAVRASGLPIRFVTNTTSRAAREIVTLLRSAGIDLESDELITASVATAMYLSTHHRDATVMVLNEGSNDDLRAFGITSVDSASAEVVVVGGGGPTLSWDRLNLALRSLLRGGELVGMNGGVRWTTSDGACLDGGAYVHMLAEAAGCASTVVGKPSPTMFTLACSSMSVEPDRALMVGDDIVVDIAGAQAAGLHGVLVRTGKFRRVDLEHPRIHPSEVIDSVADLPGLLGL